ncbi:Zinc finger protein isoform 1 [Schistosoma japonicum]|uniref:Zinc finger protein isoform 1 n=2 Tax=Schistosoma japonicum TaxID=6182 RepID=A0A4Z2DFY1_SCHJA|nr:Zinc finger protein isoform 1 [Schistosoma japonicum]
MPELNMFTVRPADGGSRLVTRGLEDILPSAPKQSILTPPTEDEWDSDLIGCDETTQNPDDVTTFTTRCEITASNSFSCPLFIDVPSRASVDEGPSCDPMTTLSGLPSNSTASFGLSPILDSYITDVNIPKQSGGHFDVSPHRTFADNPCSQKSTLGTSLPSRGFMDTSSVTHLAAQRVGSKSDDCFHKRWDTFSSQPELSLKGLTEAHNEDVLLENIPASIPSQTSSFQNQTPSDYMVEAVLHWIESISPSTTSESNTWEKVDINELKETMKTLLASSNPIERDCVQDWPEDCPQLSIYSPSCCEQTHLSVIGTNSRTSMPLPCNNTCSCAKSNLIFMNSEANAPHFESTGLITSEPHRQQQVRYRYCSAIHPSKYPKCFPDFKGQNSLEFINDKVSLCDCKLFQGDPNLTCENASIISHNFIHSLDSGSDIFGGPEPSSNPFIYAQQILPSLINERGSVSFQLLSSILAHSRIECNQDCQSSMLLDGLKQALSSIMYQPTNVPSATVETTTNVVYCSSDPIYSRSHSSVLHEDIDQSTTGYTVPVPRHLSCVGFTDNLSPTSLVESPTHNVCLDSHSETHNIYSRPSESDSCFSESCISPSHINTDHSKESQTASSSYPGGSTEMFHRVFFPPRGKEFRSEDFSRQEISHTTEQSCAVQLSTSNIETPMRSNVIEINKPLKFHISCNYFTSQPQKSDYKDSVSSGVPLRIGLPPLTTTSATTTSGRVDVRKCRKVYGIENRDQWCNQCKWKKACRRFPNPCSVSKHTQGLTNNRNISIEKTNRQSLECNTSEMCVICSPSRSSDISLPCMAASSSWPISNSLYDKSSVNSMNPYKNITRQ